MILIKKSIVLFLILFTLPLYSRERLKLLLTSNLESSYTSISEESKDPLILLAKSIVEEKKNNGGLYIDMGNSFYPDVLSKYSFGASMINFFNFTECRSTLISSNDIQIGLSNLLFIKKKNKTDFLSANILQKDKPLFKPYFIKKNIKTKIAFIALSSPGGKFNIAEKNIYQYKFSDASEILDRILPEVKGKSDKIIILSGLNNKSNLKLLKKYREINLIISGGDNSAEISSNPITRIDQEDNRSLIVIPKSNSYYTIDLIIDDTIRINSFKKKSIKNYKISGSRYREFRERHTLWKKHFFKDYKKTIIETPGKVISIKGKNISELLRYKLNCEIAIVKSNSFTPIESIDKLKKIELVSSINDNYPLFIFKLKGSELIKLKSYFLSNISSGIDLKDLKVQNYKISDKKEYSITATQSSFDDISKIVQRKPDFKNTWKTLSDIVIEDLKYDKKLLEKDFSFIDNRFRTMIEWSLSFLFEDTAVYKGENVAIPLGKSDESSIKYGLESEIKFIFYNQYHYFMISPYIYYIKKDGSYLENLLRGRFFYNLNIDYLIKPYLKSQVNTLLIPVDDEFGISTRPTDIRETMGANLETKYVNGKLGFGFEKQVRDPVKDGVIGIEFLVNFNIDFFSYCTYKLTVDSFLTVSTVQESSEDSRHFRSDIINEFIIKFNEELNLTLKHRWYLLYSMDLKEFYSNSQITASLGLNMDFKW